MAQAIHRAHRLRVPCVVFSKGDFFQGPALLDTLQQRKTDFIVLAGFLWLIPEHIIQAYPNRIINIHPALLPEFGGKGMYGNRVHQAVLEACKKESGISIHLVNEHYDEGKILYQAKCPVLPTDSVESLAQRIHELEYEHYPRILSEYFEQLSD